MMAEAARARGATPVFVTPVSSIACSGTTPVGSRGAYVTATFEAGAESEVPVIDLHQMSVDLYADWASAPFRAVMCPPARPDRWVTSSATITRTFRMLVR